MNSQSAKASGPIVLLNDRVLRAGQGVVAVWNIDALDQHVPGEKKPIGGKISTSHTWCDDGSDEENECIEPSAGNKCHASIALENQYLCIGPWTPHPSTSGVMLVAPNPWYHGSFGKDRCHAIDLESGRVAAKYIGHGSGVATFSTSKVDPHTFLTGSYDGYVRLFDTRQPLPILTVDVSSRHDSCASALFIHPDGIPTIITGSGRGENIKVWDVRARAQVYELATGNNAVVDMVWDDTRSVLYAATECMYVDRMGFTRKYRPAKLPKRRIGTAHNKADVPGPDGGEMEVEEIPDDSGNMEGCDEEDDDDDDDDDDGYESENDYRWPRTAEHAEDYFGYTFDSCEDRLFRYTFKHDVNPDVLPGWGDANI
ncbi:hypothetical protein HYDPIDRAFT_26166 [Hydnomerulius pinastri MD-312]|nr:hypothetical protein HYDPIDRAFT_26166 [Hydnomerulius pinastri MD-312]